MKFIDKLKEFFAYIKSVSKNKETVSIWILFELFFVVLLATFLAVIVKTNIGDNQLAYKQFVVALDLALYIYFFFWANRINRDKWFIAIVLFLPGWFLVTDSIELIIYCLPS